MNVVIALAIYIERRNKRAIEELETFFLRFAPGNTKVLKPFAQRSLIAGWRTSAREPFY